EAGIEESVFEAKIIIKHITGFNNTQILENYGNELTEFQQNNLTAILRQREIRYPLQYILGEWDFYKYKFKVGVGVLIPRSDTEVLVLECAKFLQEKQSPKVLDLCSGSGCIGISLAKDFPDSAVVLVEKYSEALRYIEKNVELNSADNTLILQGDIFEGAANSESYDLIVSNPPYIPPVEMEITSPEVKFEPETALLGGEDGLDFYRAITENYKNALNSGGMLAFEVGINEAKKVKSILTDQGFDNIKIVKDYNEIERVVTAIKV
ncbi:MAG: peptide chain release factor N(5)-glutamine methyltransferase, partial [Ruminococcaceae bacterium]|nr:peptide chain release factor N(5)-glutamine methyltransferase [Oscillospiraceae bacterium]